MTPRELIDSWFSCWNEGRYHALPITQQFKHTSPFGTIEGKEAYLNLVKKNEDKFLGYKFEIHDAIYGDGHACVRYTGRQGEFSLDVSEWYYVKNELIDQIHAYYHIGEIRDDRKLEQ